MSVLEDLYEILERIEKSKKVIICSENAYQSLYDALKREGFLTLYKLQTSSLLDDNIVYVCSTVFFLDNEY